MAKASIKECKSCGKQKPETADHFHAVRRKQVLASGETVEYRYFRGICKDCVNARKYKLLDDRIRAGAVNECSVDGCERPVKVRGFCGMHYSRFMKNGDPGPANRIQKRHSKYGDFCSVDGCDKPHKQRGYCAMHYSRVRKSGDPGSVDSHVIKNAPDKCTIDGCDKPYAARGYCIMHYARWQKNGDPGPAESLRPAGRICSVDGCERPYFSNNYCTMHAQRARNNGGDPGPAERLWHPQGVDVCRVDGCERKPKEKGYCQMHARRIQVNGEPGSPEPRGLIPDGTTRKIKEGYVAIRMADHPDAHNKWMPEHRYIMSEHLGRRLRKKENVHHINGVKDDNRIENLELWISSQPSGQRVIDKIGWAEEILQTYAPERDRLYKDADL